MGQQVTIVYEGESIMLLGKGKTKKIVLLGFIVIIVLVVGFSFSFISIYEKPNISDVFEQNMGVSDFKVLSNGNRAIAVGNFYKNSDYIPFIKLYDKSGKLISYKKYGSKYSFFNKVVITNNGFIAEGITKKTNHSVRIEFDDNLNIVKETDFGLSGSVGLTENIDYFYDNDTDISIDYTLAKSKELTIFSNAQKVATHQLDKSIFISGMDCLDGKIVLYGYKYKVFGVSGDTNGYIAVYNKNGDFLWDDTLQKGNESSSVEQVEGTPQNTLLLYGEYADVDISPSFSNYNRMIAPYLMTGSQNSDDEKMHNFIVEKSFEDKDLNKIETLTDNKNAINKILNVKSDGSFLTVGNANGNNSVDNANLSVYDSKFKSISKQLFPLRNDNDFEAIYIEPDKTGGLWLFTELPRKNGKDYINTSTVKHFNTINDFIINKRILSLFHWHFEYTLDLIEIIAIGFVAFLFIGIAILIHISNKNKRESDKIIKEITGK